MEWATGRRGLGGVAEPILKDLEQPVAIRKNLGKVSCHIGKQLKRCRRGQWLLGIRRSSYLLGRGDTDLLNEEAAGLHLGHVEEVVGASFHMVRGALDRPDRRL